MYFWFGFLIGYIVAHPVMIITIQQLAKYFRRRDQKNTPPGDKRKDN